MLDLDYKNWFVLCVRVSCRTADLAAFSIILAFPLFSLLTPAGRTGND